jgi:cytochrome P450
MLIDSSRIENLSSSVLTICALFAGGSVYVLFYKSPAIFSSLDKIPGPFSFRLSSLRMIYADWCGKRTRTLKSLHDSYGPVVRIGSNEVSFSSLSALRTIYGAGSSFERTSFYRPFDVYGEQNLFTFGPKSAHSGRKKLLSHIYANRTVLSSDLSPMIEEKVAQFLAILEKEQDKPKEIFSLLHYYSIDIISTFVYGPQYGGTTALLGNPTHRALLTDILSPARRKLAWFAVHLPTYTKWALSRSWPLSALLKTVGLLPMAPPTTYSGIRAHALAASTSFIQSHPTSDDITSKSGAQTVISRLRTYQLADPSSLSDLEIASECADHLLAGIDTTADTLLFLLWALSLPKNSHIQSALRAELQANVTFDPATGVPLTKNLASLPYLSAVVRETLRLYAPLPTTEPRLCRTASTIDGFAIPANTVVGSAVYVLHRDSTAYPDPLTFDPERWLSSGKSSDEDSGALLRANRNFWAFSSGARMCIGEHLAMSEMNMLVAAIYGRFSSSVRKGEESVSPGVTSRFEVFWDETAEQMVEHDCWIRFEKVK